MPVERLAALATSWTELSSTSGIKSMTADPYTYSKAGNDPNNAILVRCGAGFIHRSTDGGSTWSTVTPTSDPPNDAGDSPAPTVANVTFNVIEGSVAYINEFVVLATWQNASSEWRTWLYHTNDNFATNGTWTAITQAGGTDLSSWNTAQSISGNDAATTWPAYEWSQSGLGIHAAIKLTSTKVAVGYQDYNSTSPIYKAYIRVIDIQPNGTLLIGNEQGPWNYYDNGNRNEVHGFKIFAWDDQRGIIISHEYDYEFSPTSNYKILARMFLVSGQTVTFGDAINVEDDITDGGAGGAGSFYPYHWDFKKLPGSNNDGIVAYSDWFTSPSNRNGGYARIIRHSGSLALSKSSTYYTWATRTDDGCSAFGIVALDDTYAVVIHDTAKDVGDGVYGIYAKPLTISGFTITPGTRQYMAAKGVFGKLYADKLTDTKLVCAYHTGSGVMKSTVISRSGSTYTAQNTQTLAGTYTYQFSLDVLNESRWIIVYDDLSVGDRCYGEIGYLTGTYTHTYGTAAYIDDNPPQEYAYPCAVYLSSSMIFMYMMDDDYANEGVAGVTHSLDGGYEVKGLGLSISKVLGNRVWITGWQGSDELGLVDFDLTTMSIVAIYSLGAATEAQVNAKTYIAYPLALDSDEGAVVVFGRMDSPQGLSSPEHIIYAINDSSAFASLINNWGSVYCGSVQYHYSGLLYAIKNNGSSSQLYVGNLGGMSLMSTLPHASGVTPQGMKVDWFNRAVYASAISAGSVMVAYSLDPYSTWENITLNHDTSVGVTSTVIL